MIKKHINIESFREVKFQINELEVMVDKGNVVLD